MTQKQADPGVAKKDKGFSAAEYNAVAVSAELLAINLLSSKFDVVPDCVPHLHDWKLSYDRRIISCSHDPEHNDAAAILQYVVTAKYGRKRAMSCSADYGVIYSVPGDATREAAVGFCRNVGSFAAYPYFRALVAQMAWNAGLALPPLPSIASTAHIPKKQGSVVVEHRE